MSLKDIDAEKEMMAISTSSNAFLKRAERALEKCNNLLRNQILCSIMIDDKWVQSKFENDTSFEGGSNIT